MSWRWSDLLGGQHCFLNLKIKAISIPCFCFSFMACMRLPTSRQQQAVVFVQVSHIHCSLTPTQTTADVFVHRLTPRLFYIVGQWSLYGNSSRSIKMVACLFCCGHVENGPALSPHLPGWPQAKWCPQRICLTLYLACVLPCPPSHPSTSLLMTRTQCPIPGNESRDLNLT